MLMLSDQISIFVYTDVVDMRKAINGLAILVAEQLDCSPQSGDVFIFRNKARDKVKVLVWDKNGFIMHYKRLEKGRFKFPKTANGLKYAITKDQLSWLLAGLDFILMNDFNSLNYESFY